MFLIYEISILGYKWFSNIKLLYNVEKQCLCFSIPWNIRSKLPEIFNFFHISERTKQNIWTENKQAGNFGRTSCLFKMHSITIILLHSLQTSRSNFGFRRVLFTKRMIYHQYIFTLKTVSRQVLFVFIREYACSRVSRSSSYKFFVAWTIIAMYESLKCSCLEAAILVPAWCVSGFERSVGNII